MPEAPLPYPAQGFASFREFYPYYLGEHRDATCRRLHVVGTGLVIATALTALLAVGWVAWLIPLFGYGFAWVGHFRFEHNRPATFKHPFYSLMGDFVMFKDVLTGRIRW
ncbi:MAG: Mpo1-like protein [Pseudomonadota bacterium]